MSQVTSPPDTLVIAADLQACLPERLHPFSRQILDAWLLGELPTQEFLRWFSMPNSDYLPVSECLLKAVFGV